MQNLIIIVLMKNRKAKVEKDHDSDHEDDQTEINEES
jgi:hypothetical protein